ncbi:MAG: GerAB/ArcD/ProY family transporter [Ruminiclostridium sp.]|nr:GerAB/ArcD/ProY family transporter [Ruminiclostridium sp.]
MINNKISAGSFAAVLALSRVFTEVSSLPWEHTEYGMQRFTAVILSFLLTGAVYIPAAAAIKHCGGESPITVIAGRSKLLSGFTGVLLSVFLLTAAAETGLRSHYYASVTVLDYAPPLYFCVTAGTALLFAVHKGLEASVRTGTIAAAIFVLLLVLIICALAGEFHTERLYPAFTDRPETLWSEVIKEFSRNSEFLIFAVLCGNVSSKALRTVPLYLGGSCLTILLMTFMYNTVFGHLTSRLMFPFYTLSSISDITLLHRLNGIDVTVWIMAGILKTALFSLSFGNIVRVCFGCSKAADIASLLFGAAALALSELFTVIPALTGTAARICGSGVPLMCAALFLPAAALLCSPKSDVRTGGAGKGTAA